MKIRIKLMRLFGSGDVGLSLRSFIFCGLFFLANFSDVKFKGQILNDLYRWLLVKQVYGYFDTTI